MLIGLEKKFLYIANTKTGSTSIEMALAPYADIQRNATPQLKHIGISEALAEYADILCQAENGPGSFLKFAVMRDPVDWIVSWFRFRKRKDAMNPLPAEMTLEEFWERRDWTFQNREGRKNLQSRLFTSGDGEVLMDRIIPYPKLTSGVADIFESLGIEAALPTINVSEIKASDVPISVSLRRELEAFFEEDYDLYRRLTQVNKRPSPAVRPSPDENRPLGPATDYMFLFAPNNSGSTIISQYIASQIGGYVPPFGNNEGQNLPELRDIMHPGDWTQSLGEKWPEIRQAFDNRRDGAVFVEASPPNIGRVRQIRKEFDGSASYLFSCCNPYQNFASCLYNYKAPPIEQAMQELLPKWLSRLETLRQAIAQNPDIPFLSYEAFCENPSSFNRLFGLPPVTYAPLEGKKNTQISQVRNLAARTISFLSEDEIDRVTDLFSPHRALIEFFGYRLMSGAEMIASFAGQDGDIEAGKRRRATWQAEATRRNAKRRAKRITKTPVIEAKPGSVLRAVRRFFRP